MTKSIAVLRGTFAKPGVSQNGRLYTRAHIAEAAAEAQRRIASGTGPPISMLTHHGARDPKVGDVTRTAGRVTKVGVSPEGNGTFEAEIVDTAAGRDVAALTTAAQPALKGVSMASMWKGTPRKVVTSDGQVAETADGFSLKGIDFTHNPGIEGAEVTSAEVAEGADAGLIFESIKGDVFMERVNQPSLSDGQIKEVFRFLRVNGQSPPILAKVARQYGITESLVGKLGKLITESGDPVIATPTPDDRRQYLAGQLQDSVNRAEAKPIHQASLQDLEALAAAAFPR